MPIARIAGTIMCPKCPEWALKSLDEGRLLLCDHCGKVYAAPSVDLVEVGDRIPESMIPPGKAVYYLEPGKPVVMTADTPPRMIICTEVQSLFKPTKHCSVRLE